MYCVPIAASSGFWRLSPELAPWESGMPLRPPALSAPRRRQGAILIIVAVCLIMMLTFASLAIDFTFMMYERQRAQNAVDSASHAALIAYTSGAGDAEEMETVALAMMDRHGYDDAIVEVGAYEFDTRSFYAPSDRTNAVRVSLEAEDVLQNDLFIAPRLNLPLAARGGDIDSVSAIQPREIYFVLDQSCSMATDAKVASMTQGTLLALDAILDTDPNGIDHTALIGFGDAGFLHTPLTNVSDNYNSLRDEWADGICLCTMDPLVKYLTYRYTYANPEYAEAYDLVAGGASYDEESMHPLELGEAHYGTEGNVEHTFRCCEPHCDETLEAQDPPVWDWTDWYQWYLSYDHGNGVLWGLQVAEEEIEDNSLSGAYRMIIVLGDGADYCPGLPYRLDMPEPCLSGGDLEQETEDYAAELRTERNVHIFPVYYGNRPDTLAYYTNLATGDGEVYNPSTPEELEGVFAEIVWRSQVVLVPE